MRTTDELWDTLTECFGQAKTSRERGRRNLAVQELREAEATPEQVRIAYIYCKRTFPRFTELAVCAHFSRALLEASSNRETLPEMAARLRAEREAG